MTAPDRSRLAIAAFIVIAVDIAALLMFGAIWRRQPFEDAARQPGGWTGAIAMFVAGAAVHELLHAVAWKMRGRIPWRAIRLRRSRRKLGIIADVNSPLPPAPYRFGVAVPVALMGLLPMLAGLAGGNGLWLLWGAVFFFESFSDVAVLMEAIDS